ncbi:hypothetical protein ACIQ7Q_25670 [Streptomyces sp. NPDC096176]|uniref:hypothetical protein n=1 Tax=Streptomyces sp. NPDC096176 TaxID=3366079 RepID=UPI00380381C5
MLPEALRHPRVRNATTAGTALAVTLLPLAVGVLLAKAAATDPMTPVNAMITSGGHRARVTRAQWRGCGRSALRHCRTARTAVRARSGRHTPAA